MDFSPSLLIEVQFEHLARGFLRGEVDGVDVVDPYHCQDEHAGIPDSRKLERLVSL